MKYRKKPVIIEAIQWTGENEDECAKFLGKSFGGFPEKYSDADDIIVLTLEGQHIASRGDYLIRGVKGEHYPCKPDIFEMTYEPIQIAPQMAADVKIDFPKTELPECFTGVTK
jgi:hypothetical protein